MLRSRTFNFVVLPLLAIVFVFALVHLFQLRFASGDVYPAYSSLRADPLGTKAFYESLKRLPHLSVDRSFDPIQKLNRGPASTLFILGLDPYEVTYATEEEGKDIETFLHNGGRLVIALYPQNSQTWSSRRKAKEVKRNTGKGTNSPPPLVKDDKAPSKDETNNNKKTGRKTLKDEDGEPTETWVSLTERWGFEIDYKNLDTDDNGITEAAIAERSVDQSNLPQTLSWHSAVYFRGLEKPWNVLYKREDQPVIIERSYGRGSIVLLSDSYHFSNEALRNDRQSSLLATLVGSNDRLLFDEVHLGVQNDPGVASLARKYNLHGLVGALLLLAGLFIWKNSMSFVPPVDDKTETADSVTTAKDSASGFVNLLRRSISPSEILSTCVTEWKKSFAHGRGNFAGKAERIEQVLQREKNLNALERNPVQAYREINEILSERK